MSPGLMYDAADPSGIPADAEFVALYYNGLYQQSPPVARKMFPKSRIFWIDVLNQNPEACGILDVETGDAVPNDVKGWVRARLRTHPSSLCRLYCNLSTWPEVKHYVGKLSLEQRKWVRYWIANPTNPPKEHFVPGSNATQYEWGNAYDLSCISRRAGAFIDG